MLNAEYKNLAAAVVRVAVGDLGTAYKKVHLWDNLDKSGKLEEYVQKEKQKKTKTYDKITFTWGERTAINFFKPESKMRELYFAILNIDDIPMEIVRQKDIILQIKSQLEKKIRYFCGRAASKKRPDE